MQGTDWCLVLITVVLNIIGYIFLYRDLKQYNEEEKEQEKQVNLQSIGLKIYAILMVMITVGVTFVLIFVYKDNEFVFNLKRVALLTLLWPIAWIDYHTYRIPNSFILLGIGYRIFLIPFECFFSAYSIGTILLSDIIASVALFITTFLCRLIIKNSIGAGDVKLFLVLGLMLGLQGIWGAVFMSLIVSFVVAVCLLLTKRKGRKDEIPFGPAIMLGTFISVILTGM